MDNNLFNFIKEKAFGRFSKGLGSMLIVTSAMSWALASAAQIFGILKNDKYSKEEKSFLVRQEIADASLNIVSFCAITTGCKNLSKKLVDSGKIVTPKIANFCKKQNIDLSQPKTSISKIVNEKIDTVVKNIQTAKDNATVDLTSMRKTRDSLKAFKNQTLIPLENGAEVLGTLAGGIVASNVLTPVFRNKIAAASLRKQQQNPYQTQSTTLSNSRLKI